VAATIERGRQAFERRAWADAYEMLAAADEQRPLAAGDLERLAIAGYLVGKDVESTKAWERAHRECASCDDLAGGARCAFWLAFLLMLSGETARAAGWLARTSRLIDDAQLDCAARGYLLVPPAIEALESGDSERAQALANDASEIARRFADRDLQALAWLLRGEAAIAHGETLRGITLLDEVMVSVTTGEVSPIPAGIVYCAVIEACMDVFDLRRAAEWTASLDRWCDAQPDLVPFRGQCLVHRSQVLQAHGDWSEAASEAERARVRLSQPPHPALGEACYQQAELHRLRGEFPAAERAYRQAGQWGREPAPGFALLRLDEGDEGAAATAIRRMLDETPDRVARPAILAAYVEIMVAARDLDAAQRASGELSRLAVDVDAPLLHAMADRARGAMLLQTGDARAALASLRRACNAMRELAVPYEMSRARVLVARALEAMGDHDAASVELDAARAVFERLGAAPELARLRGPAERVLTERECQVLRLVAGGLTNRAIGAELVISEHTVARHVQNIFTKLHLSSRAGATAYAYEHGLL
jgi:ATP/maltotriose-dependent transcriptional regulator MalT